MQNGPVLYHPDTQFLLRSRLPFSDNFLMTQGLAKYHARAPRYILNTDDNFLIRIAGPRQIPWEEGTEIKNVSLTGLAFTAPEDLCPLLGEVIKIQFSVPGSQQMACHAIVTRLETAANSEMLVGVHFYKLEMAHRIVLAQGLSQKFKNQQKKHIKTDSGTSHFSFANIPTIFLMGVLLYLWVAFMYGFIAWGATGWLDGLSQFFNGLS